MMSAVRAELAKASLGTVDIKFFDVDENDIPVGAPQSTGLIHVQVALNVTQVPTSLLIYKNSIFEYTSSHAVEPIAQFIDDTVRTMGYSPSR